MKSDLLIFIVVSVHHTHGNSSACANSELESIFVFFPRVMYGNFTVHAHRDGHRHPASSLTAMVIRHFFAMTSETTSLLNLYSSIFDCLTSSILSFLQKTTPPNKRLSLLWGDWHSDRLTLQLMESSGVSLSTVIGVGVSSNHLTVTPFVYSVWLKLIKPSQMYIVRNSQNKWEKSGNEQHSLNLHYLCSNCIDHFHSPGPTFNIVEQITNYQSDAVLY